MDFNFKKLTDEEVSTSVNLTDEIFFAVNGEIRKATVSQLVKAVATNVQTVTENGKYVVDARELNHGHIGHLTSLYSLEMWLQINQNTITHLRSCIGQVCGWVKCWLCDWAILISII